MLQEAMHLLLWPQEGGTIWQGSLAFPRQSHGHYGLDLRAFKPCEEGQEGPDGFLGMVVSKSGSRFSDPSCPYTVTLLTMLLSSHVLTCHIHMLVKTFPQ